MKLKDHLLDVENALHLPGILLEGACNSAKGSNDPTTENRVRKLHDLWSRLMREVALEIARTPRK